MPPARLAVGAIATTSEAASIPAFAATHRATSSVGSVRPSSTSTPRLALSAYPSFAKSSFSTRACARSGPDPIAKKPAGLIAQPAYCDAMQDAAG